MAGTVKRLLVEMLLRHDKIRSTKNIRMAVPLHISSSTLLLPSLQHGILHHGTVGSYIRNTQDTYDPDN